MNEAKHTPGPWHLQFDHALNNTTFYITHGGGDKRTQGVLKGSYATGEARLEANARLIAAAPDMAHILPRLLAVIDSEIEQRQHGGNDEDWADLKRLSDEGNAILSRATWKEAA